MTSRRRLSKKSAAASTIGLRHWKAYGIPPVTTLTTLTHIP